MPRRTCRVCEYAPILKNAKVCSWCATDPSRKASSGRLARLSGRLAAAAIAGYYAVGLLLVTR